MDNFTTDRGRCCDHTSIISRVKLQVANPMCFPAVLCNGATSRRDVWRRHPFSSMENKRLERLFLTCVSEYTIVVTLKLSVSHDLQARVRTNEHFLVNARVARERYY